MTRTKRWVVLASSLVVAAGTGYGGYTQRHLILGDAVTGDVAAENSEPEADDDAVAPIHVTPGEEVTESPSSFDNPLREESTGSAFSNRRVVRGNDDGSEPSPAGSQFNPPPLRPEDDQLSAGPSSRFGGSAVATVEVAEQGEPTPAALTPPSTHPLPTAQADGDAGAYTGNRFTPPANENVNVAVEESAPGHFGGSHFDGGSRFSGEPTAAALPATLPEEPAVVAPSSRFGTPTTNEPRVASSNLAAEPTASRPFPAGDTLAAPPIGTGVNSLRAPSALGASALPTGASVGSQIEGSGQPGAKELDGAQTPSLVMEKIAPAEIQIGKPAKFDIKVKNVGQATAENVAVTDMVPQGTRLIDTTPHAAGGQGGSVIWQLGTLRPGEEKNVSMQLMPVGEGEIGSVATVTFSAQASVRTKSTRPQLLLETSAARQVHIGQPVKLTIRLSNPGTGAATRVVLEEDVPEGLSHPGGRALEFEAGTLKPGETRELELTLSATGAGVVENVIRARADANLTAESRAAIEIVAPDLAINVDGPTKRFLDRQATHELIISNPGTAPAKNVEMVAHLPKGLKYVSANNQGQYDQTAHAVFWSLEQLSPSDKGTVSLTTLPMEAGQQKIRVESKADMNLATAQEHVVNVEGVAALFFEVADAADPIEVGGETIYEVRVINQGTKTSTNVRVAAQLPPALKPLEAGGATSAVITGQQVVFESLPRLAPKADALFRIRVQGLAKGNAQVGVQLSSDEIPPFTKEESTRVYADE